MSRRVLSVAEVENWSRNITVRIQALELLVQWIEYDEQEVEYEDTIEANEELTESASEDEVSSDEFFIEEVEEVEEVEEAPQNKSDKAVQTDNVASEETLREVNYYVLLPRRMSTEVNSIMSNDEPYRASNNEIPVRNHIVQNTSKVEGELSPLKQDPVLLEETDLNIDLTIENPEQNELTATDVFIQDEGHTPLCEEVCEQTSITGQPEETNPIAAAFVEENTEKLIFWNLCQLRITTDDSKNKTKGFLYKLIEEELCQTSEESKDDDQSSIKPELSQDDHIEEEELMEVEHVAPVCTSNMMNDADTQTEGIYFNISNYEQP